MSTIYLNGVNFGDSSKYKDLISKPTINTHIVEESNTSSDLDIFKYITKEDLEDLNHLNPYCLYAVRDEDDGPDGFYFSNGYQTYVYNNYRVVEDLIEDTTTLQYLIEDTNLYSKGLWGYIEISPGTFEFMQITSSYDNLTIVTENPRMFLQKGGYIYGENALETNIINQVNPLSVTNVDDEMILTFNMENHVYAPNTKYRLVVKYVGVNFTYEITPNGATGNDLLEFGKNLKVKLSKDSYPSSNPKDYLITLSWFKPLDVSYINPLYIKIDDSLSLKDGKISVNLTELDYSSISKVTDYLYSIHYDKLDESYADTNLIEAAPPLVGCTSFRKDSMFGRNFDTVYNENTEFVVKTDASSGRYATLGIAYSNINKEIVEKGEYTSEYKAIPFNLVDGINEKGLVASIHTLLLENPSTSQTTTPDIEVRDTKNVFLLIRYILNTFAAAKEAAEYIRDFVAVYTPNSYFSKKATTQILISDSSSTYILEFMNGKNVLTDISTKPYITNFSISKVIYNSDGSVYTPADVPTHTPTIENKIPKYSRGLERYNTLNTGYPDISNRILAREMLDDLKYDLCYTDSLASDFTRVEDSLTIDTEAATIMANSKVVEMIENYNNRTREDANTYFTSHSAIYNLLDFSLYIVAQDDTEEYLFGLPYTPPKAGYPLGEISDVIVDTRENKRLQTIVNKGILDEEVIYVEYDYQEKLALNKELSTDSTGTYISLAGVLTDTGYTYIKVYVNDKYKVLGAKRFKVKFASFSDADIGRDKYLLWNTLLSCKDSGYITFSCNKSFKLNTLNGWRGEGTVEWSVDTATWQTWDGVTELQSAVSTGKHCIHLRGLGNTALSDGTISTTFVINGQNNEVAVSGQLTTLLDYTDPDIDPGDYAFKELFKNATNLGTASSLVIPTEHSKYQNLSMFEGCINLVNIPQFNAATVLAEGSCQQMFKRCTSIVIPKVPISETAVKCFKNMYEDCTSILKTDPLPSVNVAEEAYMGMFKGCTSIYIPTTILAETVETKGMAEMFSGCTSLLQPSGLIATTFGDMACNLMFGDCESIVWGISGTVYRIPTTGVAVAGTDSFRDMMYNNKGIIPELSGTPLPNKDYYVVKPDFEFTSPNTFKVSGNGWPANINMKYSFNGVKWYTWDKTSEIEGGLDPDTNKYRLFFRSTGGTGDTLSGANFIVASDNKNVEVKGELSNLMVNPTPGNETFKGLFANNDTINISENLSLPKMDSNNTFESLFEGCVNLKNTPLGLPEELGESACLNMFKGCTKITKTPVFNGTALNNNCYESMFEGCTSLTFAYPLTETIIKEGCYKAMFKDCTELKTSPTISGNNLEAYCYSQMFSGCIKLETAPVLPIVVMAEGAYSEMFKNCKLLTSAPTLPALAMAEKCYYSMFECCEKLQVAPTLPATVLAKSCYAYMLKGCSAFFNAPTLPATSVLEEAYMGMFEDCTRLITLPDLSGVTAIDKSSMKNMFKGCTGLPTTTTILLPNAELAQSCYEGMFNGCKNIETPPALPKTTLQENCYKEMFKNCEKLKTVPALPATTLANGCYWSMFEGCITIVKPTKLPALTMVDNCYNSMYKDCISIPWKSTGKIYRVPTVGTGVASGTDWNKDMFLNNQGDNVPDPLVINTDYHLYITFNKYISITSPNDISFKHTFTEGIYYSYDKITWNEIAQNTPITIINNPNNTFEGLNANDIPGGGIVYIAGEINESNYGGKFILTGTDITIDGELIGLIEEELQSSFITNNIIKFNNLFENSNVTDASKLIIPSFSSGNNGIFKELFKGSSIKEPCQFPTTISQNCYEGAFENCTQLIYTPEFKVTTLAKQCYMNMFKGCTTLKETSQELEATTLADGCYKSMFEGCTSIEFPSIIHATNMAPNCCETMFKGCTNITWGTTGVNYRIPFDKTQTGAAATDWSLNMFEGTSGTSIPTTPNINIIYYTVPNFNKWITLNADTTYHLNNTANVLNGNLLFYSLDNGVTWTTLPSSYDAIGKICIAGIFVRNGNLVITGGDDGVEISGELIGLYNNIPEEKFDKTEYGFIGLFKNSTGLSDASDLILPKIGENNKSAFEELFANCTNLEYGPSFEKIIKEDILPEKACKFMFQNCTSLMETPELPLSEELGMECYYGMFQGCTSLSYPAILPAANMKERCYMQMFQDCSGIKWGVTGKVYKVPIDTSYGPGTEAPDWNKDMFKNNSGGTMVPINPIMHQEYHVTDYLTIHTNDTTETISLSYTSNVNPTIEYSIDGGTTWAKLLKNTSGVSGHKSYYLRGTGVSQASSSESTVIKIKSSVANGNSRIIIDGNLSSLCSDITDKYRLKGLFEESDIYDASNLILPTSLSMGNDFTSLFKSCKSLVKAPRKLRSGLGGATYASMFEECTNLVEVPQKIYLTKACDCNNMFTSCVNIISPPKLISNITVLPSSYFAYMFYDCTSLSTPALLPTSITTLGDDCCKKMFAYCRALTTPPELPVMNLGFSCYEAMFQGCSSLTTAPELPATTLAPYCYQWMFMGCNIATAPELPATTLQYSCYSGMFSFCGGLTTAPELPATTLTPYCYDHMFENCVSLTTPPELPATTLADGCYGAMFYNCTSLITAPELPATTLAERCYEGMFIKCTSLTEPLELPATYLPPYCYAYMFKDCSNIYWTTAGKEYTIPSPNIAAAKDATSTDEMFKGTSSYDGVTVPETPEVNQVYYLKSTLKTTFTFSGDDIVIKNEGSFPIKYSTDGGATWTQVPISGSTPMADEILIDGEWECTSNLLSNAEGDRINIVSGTNVKVSGIITLGASASGLFRLNTNLIDASGLVFPNAIATEYKGMFRGCTNLSKIPTLPATTLLNNCYKYMFQDCISIIDPPELPATNLKDECYMGMFKGCSGLLTPPILDSANLAMGCYKSMFEGCTSLRILPYLPATTFAPECYKRMFANCAELVWDEGLNFRVPRAGYATTSTDWNVDMFTGCSGDLPGGGSPSENTIYKYGAISKFIFAKADPAITEDIEIENNTNKNLKYSTDGTNWFDFGSGMSVIGNKIYVKGVLYGELDSNNVGNLLITGNRKVAVSGELLPRMNYSGLFANGNLYNAANLIYPAIYSGKYNCMFSKSAISVLPNLRSTSLVDNCYSGMFEKCINIENCPTFNAIELKPYCYANMFNGCINLQAPAILPVLDMAEGCYSGMFKNCSQFLWGTTGTSYRLPSNGTGTIATNWAEEMFGNNSGTLPGTTPGTPEINTEYYFDLFEKIDLKFKSGISPADPTLITNNTSNILLYSSDNKNTWHILEPTESKRFEEELYIRGNISSTRTSPNHIGVEELFPPGHTYCSVSGELLPNTDYYQLFKGTDLFFASGLLFPEESGDYGEMFADCGYLNSPPYYLPSLNVGEECYSNMYANCYNLIRISHMRDNAVLGKKACYRMYYNCNSMEYIYRFASPNPENGPIGPFTMDESSCSEMFKGCSLLREIPTLPSTTMTQECYQGMFRECSFIWGDGNDYVIPSAGTGTPATNWSLDMFANNRGSLPEIFGTPLINTIYKYNYIPITRLKFEPTVSGESFTICNNTENDLRIVMSNNLDPTYHIVKSYFRRGETRIYSEPVIVYGAYQSSLGNPLSITGNVRVTGELMPGCNYDYLFYDTSCDGISEINLTFPTQCGSYKGMFKDNKLLDVLPALPATTLTDECYAEMFMNCSGIKFVNIPTPHIYRIPYGTATGTVGTNSLQNMFAGCSGSIPEATGTPLINTEYYLTYPGIIIKSETVDNFNLTNRLDHSIYWIDAITGQKGILEPNNSISSKHLCLTNCSTDIDSLSYRLEITGTEVSVGGTLEENTKYMGLFNNNSSIIDASLLIGANSLVENCYASMFSGCTSLTTAPQLPATTLAYNCYGDMFAYCTSLTTAPELPATNLAYGCYWAMFYNCTSLTTAPELPATTLTELCYVHMFNGCASLTAPPQLPAIQLAAACYQHMFMNCTSLTTAPQLPATTLAEQCYYEMFNGCEALITPPTLPATTLPDYCYYCMFYNCRHIIFGPIGTPYRIPSGTATGTSGLKSTDEMFVGCSGDIPEETGTPEINTTYYYDPPKTTLKFTGTNVIITNTLDIPLQYSIDDGVTWINLDIYESTPMSNKVWIKGCINNRNITSHALKIEGTNVSVSGQLEDGMGYANLFNNQNSLVDASGLRGATTLTENCYHQMFSNCYNLTKPPTLPATQLTQDCYGQMFEGCTSLTTAPELPATTLASYCYYYMFKDCTSLTTPPQLPVTNLAYTCYCGMFIGCTSLTTPPLLPATTMVSSCYSSMFSGCTSLTTPPELPATTLAQSCYEFMFSGCTSLTTAPQLLVTTMEPYCYSYMFSGCTSLTTAPELPATTLAYQCYYNMFSGCTLLTTAPQLLVTTMEPYCYSYMFAYCTSLTTAPELPATTLADACYMCMFDHCASLETVPELPATALPEYCYKKMFDGCTGIIFASKGTPYRIPSGTATGTSGLDSMSGMFTGCSGDIPEVSGTPLINKTYYFVSKTTLKFTGTNVIITNTLDIPLQYSIDNGATWINLDINASTPTSNKVWIKGYINNYNPSLDNPVLKIEGINVSVSGQLEDGMSYVNLFKDQVSLVDASGLRGATQLALNCYAFMFTGCTSLTTAPELPATTLAPYCYYAMFNGCTSLTTSPQLPATTLTDDCYEHMFQGCTSLTTAPELPATTLASNCYEFMFQDCTSLTTAPELPATNLAYGCYWAMFANCTSLTTLPELPATTLEERCYVRMFQNCIRINFASTGTPYRIPSGTATGISRLESMDNMFEGCSGTVPEGTGTPLINTTYYYTNT